MATFEFGGKSGLHGRRVYTPVDRVSFVPQSENGLVEYILAYRKQVPTPMQEPDLYRGAEIKQQPGEVELHFPGLVEIVIMLTLEADNEFRRQHQGLVAKNELFKVDV